MWFLALDETLYLHSRLIAKTGGADGLRDLGALESALAQPRMTFGGADLYPTLVEKTAAFGFSLIQNHPFVDGNKRVGFAAMNIFLKRNGWKVQDSVDEQERIILGVAAGRVGRDELVAWLEKCVVPLDEEGEVG